MMTYKTEQESFWAGEFGSEYSTRNQGESLIASNMALFSKIFSRVDNVSSLIEFGANVGLNLHAIRRLLPQLSLAAVEINEDAVKQLQKIPDLELHHESILSFQSKRQMDFALIKGVLIHINPDELPNVYQLLYDASRRYICIAEYYNRTPVEVNYRGHVGKLFKRDFAGEFLDKFSDVRLVDYGFVYHRDNKFPQDDLTWFLLEKHELGE